MKNYDVYIDHSKALKLAISTLTAEKLQKSSLETDEILCNIHRQYHELKSNVENKLPLLTGLIYQLSVRGRLTDII